MNAQNVGFSCVGAVCAGQTVDFTSEPESGAIMCRAHFKQRDYPVNSSNLFPW